MSKEAQAAARCKHGMLAQYCGHCSPAPAHLPVPSAHLPVPSAHPPFARATVLPANYAVIHTGKANKRVDRGSGLDLLDSSITFVHVDGHLFYWMLEKMLACASNLEVIQVIPSEYGFLNPNSHLKLCAERSVRVVQGHIQPNSAWGETRAVGLEYGKHRALFQGLKDERRRLFDELLAMGFLEAEVTSRYFCLEGEVFVPQRVIAKEFGLSANVDLPTRTGIMTKAVLKYLELEENVPPKSEERARAIGRRVVRIRAYLANAQAQEALLQAVGLPRLPDGLPPVRYDLLRGVMNVLRSGRPEQLQGPDFRAWQSVLWRFGLEKWAADKTLSPYRTLDQVGTQFGGVTRERARQLEVRAFELFGLQEDDE